MAYKISWTPRAWKTFEANIHYLEIAWTENEIKKFVTAVDKNWTIYLIIRELA